jgi:hypothetical protein
VSEEELNNSTTRRPKKEEGNLTKNDGKTTEQ